ncbi:MAG: hypothetical protein WC581_14635 [Thermodesulfovibrionales bacterium]
MELIRGIHRHEKFLLPDDTGQQAARDLPAVGQRRAYALRTFPDSGINFRCRGFSL